MYHKFGISKYPSTNVTIEQLDSHINELLKEKYNIRSLDFIVDTIINDGQLPNNTVGISVDDADKSFLTTAWPKFKEKKNSSDFVYKYFNNNQKQQKLFELG